jgi:6-phosphogluconolactonase
VRAISEPIQSMQDMSFGIEASGFRYCVEERDEGQLSVHSVGRQPECLGRFSTGGALPCHLAIDGSGSCLAVANYGSGSLSFFTLDRTTGLPIMPPDVRQLEGRGPNSDRQEGPHAHWEGFSRDQRWLYLVDLGGDEIAAFPFDPENQRIGDKRTAWNAPPGSGPRFLVFHPKLDFAILVSELASTLTVLRISDDGCFEAGQSISSTEATRTGENLGGFGLLNAAGDRLYVTNRGHDNIGVFAIDPAGALTPIQHMKSGGKSPRMLLLSEHHARMAVANEEGDCICLFRLLDDGTLERLPETISIRGPAFLALVAEASGLRPAAEEKHQVDQPPVLDRIPE